MGEALEAPALDCCGLDDVRKLGDGNVEKKRRDLVREAGSYYFDGDNEAIGAIAGVEAEQEVLGTKKNNGVTPFVQTPSKRYLGLFPVL